MTHLATVLLHTLADDFDRADYLTDLCLVPEKPERGTVPILIENPFYSHLDFQDRYEPWSEDSIGAQLSCR